MNIVKLVQQVENSMQEDKNMLSGRTKSGFEFEIDNDILDDWELLECFREIDRGNEDYIVDAAKQLLGDEQYGKLKDFVREKYGRVKASVMADEIVDIMNHSKEGKNS